MSGAGLALPGSQRKRRRRTPLIVLGVVVVLLLAAAVVLDGIARSSAQSLIQTKVRAALALPASTPVDVAVGGTSVLLQLAGGRLERVNVTLPRFAFGGLSGDAELTVRGLPIEPSQPIDSASLTLTTNQAGVQKLLGGFAGLPLPSVTLADGGLKLSGDVDLFGLKIPVSVIETPSAVDGKLVLVPTSFMVNRTAFSRAEVNKTLGSLGESLTKPQRLCIAGALPKAFHLDRVTITGSSARLAISAKSVLLNDRLFAAKGVCP